MRSRGPVDSHLPWPPVAGPGSDIQSRPGAYAESVRPLRRRPAATARSRLTPTGVTRSWRLFWSANRSADHGVSAPRWRPALIGPERLAPVVCQLVTRRTVSHDDGDVAKRCRSRLGATVWRCWWSPSACDSAQRLGSSVYRLGSDRGSPNHGSTVFSKRVIAQISSPARVMTKRPTPWLMPVEPRR
jgi:hypothetical protein